MMRHKMMMLMKRTLWPLLNINEAGYQVAHDGSFIEALLVHAASLG